MLRNKLIRSLCGGTAATLALLPLSASADVKDGVDAWTRGDFAAAVSEWQAPAEAGDPDAMFNLAQAYRLGRGVAPDIGRAEKLYAQAAALGHLQAADTYGLMLFQDGRRETALPFVQSAARRGDPRSQYLLGIAYFNGDFVERDWVRAYALVSLAASTGLPQAGPALVQMDELIPLAQRQEAAGLAVEMRQQADAARARELAAVDLVEEAPGVLAGNAAAAQARPPVSAPAAQSQSQSKSASAAGTLSVANARAAVAQAEMATGVSNPATAGASYAPSAPAVPVAATAAQRPPAPDEEPKPASAARSAAQGGPWAVQLGAFSISGNADRLWAQLSDKQALSGARKLLVPSSRVTKLLAGGFASRDAAAAACRRLKDAGQECLVTKP